MHKFSSNQLQCLYFEFTGGLSIGVPGEIKGLHEAWKIGGKLPWKDLFQPTIKRLRDGFKVSEPLAVAISQQTTVLMRQEQLRQVQDAVLSCFSFLFQITVYHNKSKLAYSEFRFEAKLV